jgi:EAL and modified HD-GYP domain-containing signal transduction protein
MALETSTDSLAFVGRQPIVTSGLDVFGYELLFRMGGDNAAGVTDGEASTAQVVLSTFIDIGLDNVVGRKRGFVNVPRDFLAGNFARQLPAERVVLEILETVEPDSETLAAARDLSAAGYLLALDDFRPGSPGEGFLPYVRMVKLDFRDHTRDGLVREVARLKGRGLQLVVERVETPEEFDLCRRLGFDLFQGYHVARPAVVSGPRQRSQRASTLRLLSLLSSEATTIDEIEEALSLDVVLSHKLLRVVNSAAFSLKGRVESLRQAVLFLGRERIRTWVTLIVLAGLNPGGDAAFNALLRARMCEGLGQLLDPHRAHVFFTVGLLSTLDGLLGVPMDEVLASLPLSQEINDALLARGGVLGEVLAAAEAHETCDWERVRCRTLTDGDFKRAWLDALRWTRQVEHDLELSQ